MYQGFIIKEVKCRWATAVWDIQRSGEKRRNQQKGLKLRNRKPMWVDSCSEKKQRNKTTKEEIASSGVNRISVYSSTKMRINLWMSQIWDPSRNSFTGKADTSGFQRKSEISNFKRKKIINLESPSKMRGLNRNNKCRHLAKLKVEPAGLHCGAAR